MKRKPPIVRSLLKSSKSAMMAAIEIHNKPQISYRYEIVVLLIINSWELVLKAYIYKNLKNIRLFNEDGTTKPFPECVACVFSNLGKEFIVFRENIDSLYEYRNKIAHFYEGILDPILFMLVKKNILFYCHFINTFFKIDLAHESNLYLLPIGFKPLYSPIDYLTKHSNAENRPILIAAFLDKIVRTSERLLKEGIEDSILADFNLNLINVNKIKNADIIVGLSSDPSKESRAIIINKKVKVVSASEEKNQPNILITRDKSKSSGVIMHEELSEELFSEINNVISVNKLLASTSEQFRFGEEVYFRIYAERGNVDNDKNVNLLMVRTTLNKFYAPGLYWFLRLDDKTCATLILEFVESMKFPFFRTFIRLILLLGENISNWFGNILNDKWGKHTQPPAYYWAFKEIQKAKRGEERRLLALRMTANQNIELTHEHKNIKLDELLRNTELASQYLSKTCFDVFEGFKEGKGIARDLDIIVYGKAVEEKAEKIAKEMGINK